jgi:hypothetical protein
MLEKYTEYGNGVVGFRFFGVYFSHMAFWTGIAKINFLLLIGYFGREFRIPILLLREGSMVAYLYTRFTYKAVEYLLGDAKAVCTTPTASWPCTTPMIGTYNCTLTIHGITRGAPTR